LVHPGVSRGARRPGQGAARSSYGGPRPRRSPLRRCCLRLLVPGRAGLLTPGLAGGTSPGRRYLGYPDYGRSTPPADRLTVATEAALADLAVVIAWLSEVPGSIPLHLIGWSWGGRITSHYAARWPEPVDRRGLLDPALGGGLPVGTALQEPWQVNGGRNRSAAGAGVHGGSRLPGACRPPRPL
jgi:pimeloyl-ACP methyl ester carboxylesterase